MIYRGYPVSPGIAIGKVFVYQPFEAVVNETQFPEEKTKEYMGRFHEICDEAEKELIGIEEFLNKKDPDKAKIFKAHQDILSDVAIVEDIEDAINCDHLMPDFSIDMVFKKYIKVLEKAKDPLIAERTADLRDVRNRLLRIWCGVQEKNLSNLPGPVIIVARDLLPSDTATLDRENVIGIATEVGGSTSHSAIIAKSYEIPAVLGICNLLGTVIDGEEVVLDACDGFLYTDATESELHDFENKRKVFLDDVHEVKEYLFREPLTADGVHIDIGLNIGSPNPEELANNECSDMVGLFRTEFLYMGSMRLPTEDEQFTAYKTVLSKYGERPVTLRTLDIGGDKTLSYMELPREDNPFLGNRALRLCFDNIPIFKTQLRAAYRASVFGNLWLMMPMVGSLDDIRGAKKIIEEVKAELTAEGIEYKKDVKVGIMIEIPSIAMIADLAADEVDFASIGTNDLCQYLTAVDRLNPAVAKYYQSYSPAMFRILARIVGAFNDKGKPICICGELGGDSLVTVALVGMGMRKLSMSRSSVARVKRILSKVTMPTAQEAAQTVQNLHTAQECREYLEKLTKELRKPKR